MLSTQVGVIDFCFYFLMKFVFSPYINLNKKQVMYLKNIFVKESAVT